MINARMIKAQHLKKTWPINQTTEGSQALFEEIGKMI